MRDMRNMGSEERKTTVETAKLLVTLKENRKQHLEEYNEAVEGYLETAREKLDEEFKKAKGKLQNAFDRTTEELDRFDPSTASDTIVFCEGISFKLVSPRNYVDAYDQAIQMMEWETRKEVELNTTEFRCFVMNKWDWMEEFKMSTSLYNSRK
jgi:hypothetical protein